MPLRIFILFFYLVVVSMDTQAGILSTLARSAKKADAPDSSVVKLSDTHVKNIELDMPNGANPDLVSAKLDPEGNWVFRNKADAPLTNLDDMANPVVVLDEANLPQNIDQLLQLPEGVPSVIRTNNGVFRLQRSPLLLKAGDANIKVADSDQLKKALFHFKSSWSSGPVRVLGASDKAEHSLAMATGVASKTLTNTPHMLKGQTIVLSGPIKQGKITAAGSKYSIEDLQRKAVEHDFSLVILESPTKVAPKALLKRVEQYAPKGQPISTGEFLGGMTQPGTKTYYEVVPVTRRQVLISQQLPNKAADELRLEDAVVELSAQVGTRVMIYRPPEDQGLWIDDLPPSLRAVVSFLIMYVLVSVMAGFWVFGACRSFMRKRWPSRQRDSFASFFSFAVFRLRRVMLVVFVIIPFLGLPLAIYRVCFNFYYIVLALLIGISRVFSVIAKPFVKNEKQ